LALLAAYIPKGAMHMASAEQAVRRRNEALSFNHVGTGSSIFSQSQLNATGLYQLKQLGLAVVDVASQGKPIESRAQAAA
jgi:hypothetical protein